VGLKRTAALALAGTLALGGLLGGGWLWLRDSSLVEIRQVTVRGATSSQEAMVRGALEAAARRMTTLHVREDALRRAVAPYPSVAGVRVSTDFPHAITIEVIENRPAAALEVGDRRVPATGGGLVLTGVAADENLPAIHVDSVPARTVTDRRTRTALIVAAAAPAPLRDRSERLWWGPNGLTVDLRDGPPLIFGDREDARAKWESAARVLAEPSAAGATYLDLRVAGRVAAGGLGPITPEATEQPEAAPGAAVAPVPTPTASPQPDPSTIG
jgi:cell division protein FtsQ